MEGENTQQNNDRLPEIIVFAGPNGSGKSTITKLAKVIEPYINADDIKRTNYCSDLDVAQIAERMREDAILKKNLAYRKPKNLESKYNEIIEFRTEFIDNQDEDDSEREI